MEVGKIKFTWKIKNFSKLDLPKLYSNVFSLEDYKWRILVYPKGDSEEQLSIYLDVADSATLPSGWSRNAEFSLTVVNQIDKNSSVRQATEHKFDADEGAWGFTSFIPLTELHDLGRGYLVEDTCIIKANVTVFRNESYGSSEEARNEIANGRTVAIKNSTEEDVDAFFVDLDSEISSINNLSSKVGEEALTVIRNTLNMDPADSNDRGRISQIKTAFDVLTSPDDYSLLTAEQKEELLNMEKKIVDLPKRAAKAVRDQNRFMQKQFFKMTLGQKLGKSLIEFRRTNEEIEQQELQIANLREQVDFLQEQVDSLLAQIGEAQKKKDNISSQQKEMFELSRDWKAELDVLEKQWPEYEAKKEAAEEVEKMVRTEWQKMRQFVSSLNKPF